MNETRFDRLLVEYFMLFGTYLARHLRNSSPFKGEVGRGMGAYGVYFQPIPTLPSP